MIIKYMMFSFAYTSRTGQAAVDGYCKFWVKTGPDKKTICTADT